MDRASYLTLMQFPREWIEWDMIPGSFIDEQTSLYEQGNENASEHDRHGIFQWWLRQMPSPEQLVLLARLTWLDPDQLMAAYVRQSIAQQPNCTASVAAANLTPYHRA